MVNEDEPIDAEVVEEAAVTPVPVLPVDYTEGGVPTFEYARDKIMGKVGAAELSGESAEVKSVDQQLAEREKAGRDKLEEIRRQLHGE